MHILTAQQVRSLLDPAELRPRLAEAYAALSQGRADVPTRIGARTASGLLGAMPGYVEEVGLGAKLVSVFGGNADRGLPTHMAIVALFDHDTGAPLAVMDGEVITQLRTSASAALACDLLAPPDAQILTIVGAGVQAAGHLRAFREIRPWRQVRVANRTAARARALVARFPWATAVDSIDEAVEGADVVACTTDSPGPVFDPARFGGRHVSSVGLGHELPAEVIEEALVCVQTRSAVVTPPPNGPAAVQGMDPWEVVELGEVVVGDRAGRSSPRQVTAWISVGNALEDVVAARLAYDRAVAEGVGGRLEL